MADKPRQPEDGVVVLGPGAKGDPYDSSLTPDPAGTPVEAVAAPKPVAVPSTPPPPPPKVVEEPKDE